MKLPVVIRRLVTVISYIGTDKMIGNQCGF
jgi:hypothetical protein